MLRILFLALSIGAVVLGGAKSEDGLIYGEAGGEKLTMDYYRPAGPGPHPVAIIIHGGGYVRGNSKNNSEAYCADFLAPAGYAVFSINYRLAPKFTYPAMVEDVQRAIRYIRYNAKKWDADPGKIALVGGSAGGYLSNMAGILDAPGIKGARDPVDRASARVQAVVTLFGPSDFRGQTPSDGLRQLLAPLIEKKGLEAALAEASPVTHFGYAAPPFLLIHGDRDQAVPLAQSTHLQAALKANGVRCDLIIIPNGPHATGKWHTVPGVPDWERQMVEWLNMALEHKGPIGEGIRSRIPAPKVTGGAE
ncbi:MAG TPA: alpha/beta hydrolase [Bryobacteraceae bacterium]|nr:alpha/beta hydrolase [Bryobacteraceae bacterium]